MQDESIDPVLVGTMLERQRAQVVVGRMPSGVILTGAQADTLLAIPSSSGLMEVEPPAANEIVVPKRTAKSTAEKLTGKPCRCFERDDGRVEIEVNRVRRYVGHTWFLALFALKQSLDE